MLDNLSSGHDDAVLAGRLIEGGLADAADKVPRMREKAPWGVCDEDNGTAFCI